MAFPTRRSKELPGLRPKPALAPMRGAQMVTISGMRPDLVRPRRIELDEQDVTPPHQARPSDEAGAQISSSPDDSHSSQAAVYSSSSARSRSNWIAR